MLRSVDLAEGSADVDLAVFDREFVRRDGARRWTTDDRAGHRAKQSVMGRGVNHILGFVPIGHTAEVSSDGRECFETTRRRVHDNHRFVVHRYYLPEANRKVSYGTDHRRALIADAFARRGIEKSDEGTKMQANVLMKDTPRSVLVKPRRELTRGECLRNAIAETCFLLLEPRPAGGARCEPVASCYR